jgi:uncharacterized Zn finger protein
MARRTRSRFQSGYGGFPPYVPVAQRRARAAEEIRARSRKGEKLDPILIEGRAISTTFWGRAWCENLERYSDYSNRLPRGRTYARNGSILDLRIEAGEVKALVQGTRLYKTRVAIRALAGPRWAGVVRGCAGQVGSLVELLRGRISDEVMRLVTEPAKGLFPEPREIELTCSCPDWATMCKHVAAVLYGVGARLDTRPELLFLLRGVDAADLVAEAAVGGGVGKGASARRATLGGDLGDIFGVEIEPATSAVPRRSANPRRQKISASGASAPEALSQPARAARSGAKPRAARASLEDRVIELLRIRPGLRVGEIGAALAEETPRLALPIRRLFAAGRIWTTGQRRGVQYWLPDQAPGEGGGSVSTG